MTEAPASPQRTVADMRKGRWPGWIWAVPIAAVAIVLWLVVREISLDAVTATVTYERAAGIKAGNTPVVYRGVKIGKVRTVSLSSDASYVIVKLDIDRGAERLLRKGTRFYLEGARPSLSNLGSLKALIAGPTLEIIPGEGPPARSFQGIFGPAPESLGVSVRYLVRFNGDVGALDAGAPVLLRGFKVGEVSSVSLGVDAASGTIATSVLIALDPRRLHFSEDASSVHDWQSALNGVLSVLIQHDLRARLARSPPLVGSPQVELATIEGAPAASLQRAGPYYEIPSDEQGGMSHVVREAENFPVKEIGENLRAITAQIKSLSASPELKQSIGHLDAALASLDRTLAQAGPKVAPTLESVHRTVDSLRRTAEKLDATVDAARQLMGTSPAASDGSLQPALLHISEAARSVRVLADYLDEHPETLIRGRR